MSIGILDSKDWKLSPGGGYSKETNPFAPANAPTEPSAERKTLSKKEMVRVVVTAQPDLMNSPKAVVEAVQKQFGEELHKVYAYHCVRALKTTQQEVDEGHELTFGDLKFLKILSQKLGGYPKLQALLNNARELQERFGDLDTAKEVIDFLAEDH